MVAGLPAVLVLGNVDGNVHLLVDGHMHFLVDGNVLDDRYVFVDGHLLDMMMVNGVHFVRNVDDYVFAADEMSNE